MAVSKSAKNSDERLEYIKANLKYTNTRYRYKGTTKITNKTTGEEEELKFEKSRYPADWGFEKMFPEFRIFLCKHGGCQKIKIIDFLIDEKTRYENVVRVTYSDISEKTGVGLSTVEQAMRGFIKDDFLVRVLRGEYMINPNMLCYGEVAKRRRLLYLYAYYKFHKGAKKNVKQEAKEFCEDIEEAEDLK